MNTIPLAFLDLWISVYQWICFPIDGIGRVRRRDYFVLDRHNLAYLNGIEKISCTFCSYANGLIAYVRSPRAGRALCGDLLRRDSSLPEKPI